MGIAAPVRTDDVVSLDLEIAEEKGSSSREDPRLVTSDVETTDQDGETVFAGDGVPARALGLTAESRAVHPHRS